jgi:hypothetical protein
MQRKVLYGVLVLEQQRETYFSCDDTSRKVTCGCLAISFIAPQLSGITAINCLIQIIADPCSLIRLLEVLVNTVSEFNRWHGPLKHCLAGPCPVEPSPISRYRALQYVLVQPRSNCIDSE